MKRCRHLKKIKFQPELSVHSVESRKKMSTKKKKKLLPGFEIKLTYYYLNDLPQRHKRLVVAKRQNANIGDQAS